MKQRRRVLAAASAAAVMTAFAAGCAVREPDPHFSVMVAEGEGYRILSENPVRIAPGENAVFAMEIREGYDLVDPGEGAVYENGMLTVTDLRYPATLIPDVRTAEETTAAPETTAASETTAAPDAPAEIVLPAVKADHALLAYHANGGTCTLAEAADGMLFDQISVKDYLLPNCRGDLGIFVREGYHLVEYNTMPDGSGQGYSLGSKILLNTGITKKDSELLYCIWLRETDSSLFTYETTEEGVTITDYHGEEDTLVIPAYIGGKPVTVIEKDACRGGTFTTLSLPKTLTRIAARAFANCQNLQTVYFPDSILSVQDSSFAQSPFPNFCINAATEPRFSPIESKKFEAVVTTQDKNRIIVSSGSSSKAGLNAGAMQKMFDDQYFVVNYGTNASGISTMYAEMLSNFVHEGDIVVAAPECTGAQLGQNEMTWRMYRETESYYNLYRMIDASRFTKLFSAFSEWQKIRMQTSPRSYTESSNGTYTVNADPVKYGKGPNKPDYWAGSTIQFAQDSMNAFRAANLNYAHDRIRAAGATVYVSFAPYNNNALSDTAKQPKVQNLYTKQFRTLLTSPVISNLSDYGLPGEHMYDSDWHPNEIGCEIRTAKLAEDLRAQMIKDNLWKE